MKKKIPFHIPFVSNEELYYLKLAIKKNSLSGRGKFSDKCENILKKNFNRNCIMTTSCTHALEIVAFLLNLKKNDEIIVPSYTFVSTANAFAIRGAKIILADSNFDNPCINPEDIKKKISKKTKAICIVHYAGISCDMREISKICKSNKIKLIEDCAHAFDSWGFGKKLGTYGDYSAFSFHATKNLTSGEGGALLLKNKKEYKQARIILEKGTNRMSFVEKKVKKYTWVHLGSSYTLSDLNCSFLYAQLKKRMYIKKKRLEIFKFYKSKFSRTPFKKYFEVPFIPKYAKVNGHIFYLICKNYKILLNLKKYALKNKIVLQEHYQALHKSPYYKKNYNSKLKLINAEKYDSNLIRFPIYPNLKTNTLAKIVKTVKNFINYKIKYIS